MANGITRVARVLAIISAGISAGSFLGVVWRCYATASPMGQINIVGLAGARGPPGDPHICYAIPTAILYFLGYRYGYETNV